MMLDGPLITPAEAAKLLNVSRPLIYKMGQDGRLPCVRIPCPGSKKTIVRFKAEDVEDFIQRYYNPARN